MYRISSLKVASLYSNPDNALGETKAIRPTAWSQQARVDLHSISPEFSYRARIEKRFSKLALASASDGCMECELRLLSFACGAANTVLTYWPNEELRPFPIRATPHEVSLARLGFEELEVDCVGEEWDDMDKEQEIWRYMKVRKYVFQGGGELDT